MRHIFTIIIAVLLFLPSSCSTKEDYVSRGLSLTEKGRYDKAIEYYNKAITIDPNYVYAYSNRGIAYAWKGEYDKAIDDFNKGILLSPNDAHIYFNRGVAYHNSGQDDKATSDLNKACDIGIEEGCKVLQGVLKKK